MLRCPFNRHAQHARRQFSLNDYKSLNVYLCFELTVLGMKVGREMIPEKHFYADAEEAADLRHELFGEALEGCLRASYQ